jgi:hypothetical protein
LPNLLLGCTGRIDWQGILKISHYLSSLIAFTACAALAITAATITAVRSSRMTVVQRAVGFEPPVAAGAIVLFSVLS